MQKITPMSSPYTSFFNVGKPAMKTFELPFVSPAANQWPLKLAMGLASLFTFAISPSWAQTIGASGAPSPISVGAPPAPLDNPYGLAALWAQGDWVAKGTLVLLLIMSLASWYILISRLLAQSQSRSYAKEAQKVFTNYHQVRESAGQLNPKSPYRAVAQAALEAESRFPAVSAQVDLSSWLGQNIENSVANLHSKQQSGLAELATIGSTAPFVGLFGTVWGIYNALVQIGATGQASLDKVAGPVGEALIMTAIGLAVAVPAVLSYNWLVRRNRQNMELLKNYASGLHSELLASPQRRSTQPVVAK
jgi:biopolymer transport protein ExbB